MGNFVEVKKDGVKTYTLFNKGSIKQVLMLQNILPMYTFDAQESFKSKEVYLDSPNNLLLSAGIILSKTTEKNKAFFKVEMEKLKTNKTSLVQRTEKIFVHNVGLKDKVLDHSFFLANGIKAMFSTQFYIDLDNVLKLIVPKIELKIKKSTFKVFAGNGFKAELLFEEIAIKNYESKRGSNLYTLTVTQLSQLQAKEFDEFTSKIEKYCKEIMPTQDSKYEIVKRMTK